MTAPTKYCHACAAPIDVRAQICPKCGVGQPGMQFPHAERELREASSKKLAAGMTAIFLGYLGIHKFILGMTTPGLIMAGVSVATCGIGAFPMGIIGVIEGIIYLTKSDEEFYELYVVEKQSWF